MNRSLLFAVVVAVSAALPAAPVVAADVGVSVQIGQPGFYGRIDIGALSPPALIYPQPVIIAPAPMAIVQRPIYLRVPPGHAKNWGKHCARYNACGQRTYFVQEDWYHTVYAPARSSQRPHAYRDDGRRHEARGHGKSKHRDRGDDRHHGRH